MRQHPALSISARPPPGDNYFATSLALATPRSHGCYSKTEQNYYVTWDSPTRFAVQLVEQDGYVKRTVVQDKPIKGMVTRWFGYGSNGHEWILFRDLTGNAWRYPAQLSSGSPLQYSLGTPLYTASPAGMQAISMTSKKRPRMSLIKGTAFNDHILFSRDGEAKLLAFDDRGDPVKDIFGKDVVWTFHDSQDRLATSYAHVPPVCP